MARAQEEREDRVTPLELFFDLVVVLGVTQVTSLLVNSPTPGGLLRGTLLLGALWWAWAGYAWLTNTVDPEEGGVRLAIFAAMGAMLVVALALRAPSAATGSPSGWPTSRFGPCCWSSSDSRGAATPIW